MRSSISAIFLPSPVAAYLPMARPRCTSLAMVRKVALEVLLGQFGVGGGGRNWGQTGLVVDARGPGMEAPELRCPTTPSRRCRPDAGPRWWQSWGRPWSSSACTSNWTFLPRRGHAWLYSSDGQADTADVPCQVGLT